MPLVYAGPEHHAPVREVKNLGWLVRALGKYTVQTVTVRHWTFDNAATLTVNFEEGPVFQARFADVGVCIDWLTRRRTLRGERAFISSTEWFWFDLLPGVTPSWVIGADDPPTIDYAASRLHWRTA